MQLLFIPVVLAVAGFWFNHRERKIEQQREAALKGYIDKLSELLLHENLGKSEPESEIRKVAHVRTLTVLPRLDSRRKRSVLQFLYEADLSDASLGVNYTIVVLPTTRCKGGFYDSCYH